MGKNGRGAPDPRRKVEDPLAKYRKQPRFAPPDPRTMTKLEKLAAPRYGPYAVDLDESRRKKQEQATNKKKMKKTLKEVEERKRLKRLSEPKRPPKLRRMPPLDMGKNRPMKKKKKPQPPPPGKVAKKPKKPRKPKLAKPPKLKRLDPSDEFTVDLRVKKPPPVRRRSVAPPKVQQVEPAPPQPPRARKAPLDMKPPKSFKRPTQKPKSLRPPKKLVKPSDRKKEKLESTPAPALRNLSEKKLPPPPQHSSLPASNDTEVQRLLSKMQNTSSVEDQGRKEGRLNKEVFLWTYR